MVHQVFYDEDLPVEEDEELESGEMFGGEVMIPVEALLSVALLQVGVDVSPQPRPGPRYCHCLRGPLHPDVDTCNLWP